jgi:hypothetical protein
MSLFNQLVRGGPDVLAKEMSSGQMTRPRSFRENIQDQISYHESKIKDLKAVLESLTPEVEKFVEAIQRLG